MLATAATFPLILVLGPVVTSAPHIGASFLFAMYNAQWKGWKKIVPVLTHYLDKVGVSKLTLWFNPAKPYFTQIGGHHLDLRGNSNVAMQLRDKVKSL